MAYLFLFALCVGAAFGFTPINEIEEECQNCTARGWGYRYFKSLPISPKEYLCLNSSRLLPYGSMVVEVVRKPEDCQDIHIRMPSRNMTDIDDFSNSYNMIDDIFIILGGARNSSTGGGYLISNRDEWFWPCILCLIFLSAMLIMKTKTMKRCLDECSSTDPPHLRRRRNIHEPEDLTIYP